MDEMDRFLSLLGLLAWDHPHSAGILLVGVLVVAGALWRFSWTMCKSHFKGEIATLKGQIGVYDQRVKLAQEQEQEVRRRLDKATDPLAEMQAAAKAQPDSTFVQIIVAGTSVAIEAVSSANTANNDVAQTLESLPSNEETSIRFSNLTSGPVDVFWIDFLGQTKKYWTLQAGESRVQPTYIGHKWIATAADHRELVRYVAEHGPKPLLVPIK
jgi:hypothetical protein